MNTNRNVRAGMGVCALVALFYFTAAAEARIKLVALPERTATVVRLDNPQSTLIEEERVLTLQKGLNKVDFSWKGVQIDMDSIRLAVLGHPDKVTLLNVSYPPEGSALVWEINSAEPLEERVRISYLLGNIDRLITYKAVTDKGEKALDLKSYIILRNFSGEDFEQAKVQLDYGEAFERNIQHEETRQLEFFHVPKAPITKVWTFDAARLPWDPEKQPNKNVGIPVSYRVENTAKSGLGKFALWNGKARIYQDDGHQSTIFLGEDVTDLVPVGGKIELYIGDSRDIVVTQRKMKDERINLRRNKNNDIILYDNDEVITAKMENFKDSPATLTLIQHIPGEWKMIECNMTYVRDDAGTLKFTVELPARDPKGPATKTLEMHYQRLNIRP
jgi:hypothetical protein